MMAPALTKRGISGAVNDPGKREAALAEQLGTP